MPEVINALRQFWTGYLVDVLDILIVAYIFYHLMLLMRGTRTVNILRGR